MSWARQVAVGAVALLFAVFAWFLHVTSAADGHHSWQSGGPPAAVTVRAGQMYHLSTRSGFADATSHSVGGVSAFSCTYSGAIGDNVPLTVDGATPDPRVLHRVATFVAPQSGRISVACADVDAVYIDDARSAAFDVSGLYVIVTVLLGLAGALLLVGGLMRRDSLAGDGVRNG